MKINFTKKQYRTLIDLVHLGEMVINGIRVPDDHIKEYKELQEYIYSFAKQMGHEDSIQFDKQFTGHFETFEYENSKVRNYLEEYNNEVFWTELASRLASRDVGRLQRMTADQFDRDEFLEKSWKREDVYQEEFEENGLENVKVDFHKNEE